ncbi:MAG: hypothetical protein HUK04_00440 [Bacteroidaceae bacterium]|nr:hypothetical protein [Bacteroidaceae bacterium]
MKKIKVSELPVCKTLKGLFTLGTDANNRSVKVSLEFVDEAADAAKTATTETQEATQSAKTATALANAATANANTATTNAIAATTAANNAATAANNVATVANNAATNANNKASLANGAAATALDAARTATDATSDTMEATDAARIATAETLATLAILIPKGMEVDAPTEITLGNTAQQRIRAILTPLNTMPNVVFISDNESVRIAPDGRIRVVGIGTSEVHIVPTCNTALAKTVLIKVHTPTARLADTRKILRLTQAGGFLLN